MHRCSALGSCLPTLSRKRALLATSLIWLTGGCGPGAATPMPEPPGISPELLADTPAGGGVPVVAPPQGFYEIYGAPHAAAANATVRVTNLDATEQPYSTTAFADGHFEISVAVAYGNELRFEWLLDGKRSVPTDVLFLQQGMSSFKLQPSPRFACVKLTPGFVLEFANMGANTLTLEIDNQCTSDLNVGSTALRRGSPDFALPTFTAAAYPPGNVASIAVSHFGGGMRQPEDILFVPLSQAGTTIRYPITLSASP